jgi:ribose/xylose/arabinose/galactoside ABC-type transport system permease subunit
LTSMTALGFRSWRIGYLPAIYIILIVVIIGAGLTSDRFLLPSNLIAVFQQAVITGIVALGMTIVLIGGQFDLSTGAVVMMSAVMALLISPDSAVAAILAVFIPILAGAAVGVVNGLAVYAVRANSIVVTIGMQFLIVGLVLAAVSGQHVYPENLAASFRAIATTRIFGIPMPVVIFAALVALLSVLMSKTVFGRHVYAIGGDIETARKAGIRVIQIGTLTFALSGALAALAGVIIAALVGHVDPTAIAKYEFPALTAVVLGGTSLSGGEGRPAETAAAILVVSVITNLMTIMNYQYPVQLLVQGILLTGAVAFYAYRRGHA